MVDCVPQLCIASTFLHNPPARLSTATLRHQGTSYLQQLCPAIQCDAGLPSTKMLSRKHVAVYWRTTTNTLHSLKSDPVDVQRKLPHHFIQN